MEIVSHVKCIMLPRRFYHKSQYRESHLTAFPVLMELVNTIWNGGSTTLGNLDDVIAIS